MIQEFYKITVMQFHQQQLYIFFVKAEQAVAVETKAKMVLQL